MAFSGAVSRFTESTVESASTISPKTDIVILTGTTDIHNIMPSGHYSGIVFFIALDGNIPVWADGNVAIATTIVQDAVSIFIYSKSRAKWYRVQ